MKGLVLIVVLLLASGVVGLLVARSRARLRPGGEHPGWWLSERADGGRVLVEIMPPRGAGAEPLPVAVLDPASDEFEYDLEEARATATSKLIALNRAGLGT